MGEVLLALADLHVPTRPLRTWCSGQPAPRRMAQGLAPDGALDARPRPAQNPKLLPVSSHEVSMTVALPLLVALLGAAPPDPDRDIEKRVHQLARLVADQSV